MSSAFSGYTDPFANNAADVFEMNLQKIHQKLSKYKRKNLKLKQRLANCRCTGEQEYHIAQPAEKSFFAKIADAIVVAVPKIASAVTAVITGFFLRKWFKNNK